MDINNLYASDGVKTIGSPLTFIDVFTKIGQPVIESESLDYRYVGLNKFTLEGMKQMLALYDKKKFLKEKWKSSGNDFKNGYMTDILQEMIDEKIEVTPHFTKNEWLEIDTESDYIVAKDLYLNKEFEF